MKYLTEDILRCAATFEERRALRHHQSLWKLARGYDTPAQWRTATELARRLRTVGVAEVRVEKAPANGRVYVGGWWMPVAWRLRRARLMLEPQGVALADTREEPLHIALYSPPTPPDGIEGPWIFCDAEPTVSALDGWLKQHVRRIRGRFIVLRQGSPSPEINRWAACHGVLGFVVLADGPTDTAVRYLNYAVPLDDTTDCIPVFSLSRAAGRTLLANHPAESRLRAIVAARRYAGSFPIVIGTIGQGPPFLYLCAHMDEPGALDNASGCAVAIEVARVLARTDLPHDRSAVLFFSAEVRGWQWWLNHSNPKFQCWGGLNLDMVGASLEESPVMAPTIGFDCSPHVAGDILREACEAANRHVGGRTSLRYRGAFVSDAQPGLDGGHVSLEQKPGPTYHTSTDRPDRLSPRELRWSGFASVAFLLAAIRLDNDRIARVVRKSCRRLSKPVEQTEASRPPDLERQVEVLHSLRAAWRLPEKYPDLPDAESFYRAGVSRRTGLWPDVARAMELDRLVSEIAAGAGIGQVEADYAARETDSRLPLVPQRLFRGFLSLEYLRETRMAAQLELETGLRPAWGTAQWAWSLVHGCRGRKTLEELLQALKRRGVVCDLAKAHALLRQLNHDGLIRWRKILWETDWINILHDAGLKRGDVVMVHVSLSRFGYVVGGAATLIRALRAVISDEGTLCMPVFSHNVLGWPPFEREHSPSLVGAVTEFFRTQPDVIRGMHPTHSIAAQGPLAAELAGAQRPDRPPLDRDGFWGRLCERDGKVLLLCPIRSATIFHVGETWLGLPQRRLVCHARDETGRRRVYELPNAPWHVDHFEPFLARPLMRRGLMRVVPFGESELYLASARSMAEISVQVLAKRPEICLGKNGTCTCAHCRVLREGLHR